MTIRLPCILLLDPSGVRQYDPAEVHRARRAKHPTLVAVRDETRQVADVIEVRMGEYDGVDVTRGDGELRPVAEPQLLQSLEEATVEEHALAAVFEQVLGPGYGAGGAQKRQMSHDDDDIRLPGRVPRGQVLICRT